MSNTAYCPTCGKPTGVFQNRAMCFFCGKTVTPVEKPIKNNPKEEGKTE